MKEFILFKITFSNGSYISIINKLFSGGLMVVPSGPGLATIGKDLKYTKAVQMAGFAIPDSAYMVLHLNFIGKSIYKILKRILKAVLIQENSLL